MADERGNKDIEIAELKQSRETLQSSELELKQELMDAKKIIEKLKEEKRALESSELEFKQKLSGLVIGFNPQK